MSDYFQFLPIQLCDQTATVLTTSLDGDAKSKKFYIEVKELNLSDELT